MRLWAQRSVLFTFLIAGIYIALAIYLLVITHSSRAFSEEQLIRDFIWLDAWAILFLTLLALLVTLPMTKKMLAWPILTAFSIYGFVTISLFLAGTPFSSNAFWGDQQFRQAMILTFQTFSIPGDFYYKDLPCFYPPLYYWLLSLYARVFSLEAYQMLKVGSLFIYLLGPPLLFLFWRKLVTTYQALIISIATFMIGSINQAYPLLVPHAFLADILFVPWWLYYVDNVRRRPGDWKLYVTGGLIGGALFSTYFYAFFIGGFLIALRFVLKLSGINTFNPATFSFKRAFAILSLAATASAPYWLPLIISIYVGGIDRSRGGWHSAGATGLVFDYLELTVVGVAYVTAILYLARHHRLPVHKSLLSLLLATVVWWFVGSLAGAHDFSLNLIKTRQFVHLLGGPVIGLALAGVSRWVFVNRVRWRFAAIGMMGILLLYALNGFNSGARHKGIRTARTASLPIWHELALEHPELKGSVVLAGDPALHSFIPVHAFNTVNEHYAHPGSRYKDRLDLLLLLEKVPDAGLISIVLRHNIYDRVDYVAPLRRDGSMVFPANVSNYPNRSFLKTVRFQDSLLNDDRYFDRMDWGDWYGIRSSDDIELEGQFKWEPESSVSSGGIRARLFAIRRHLNEQGQFILDHYIGEDWNKWLRIEPGPVDFEKTIGIVNAVIERGEDSLTFHLAVQSFTVLNKNYKVFLHVYATENTSTFDNYDFSPVVATTQWQKWGIYFVQKKIPLPDTNARIHFGFFRGNKRLGDGAWIELPGGMGSFQF